MAPTLIRDVPFSGIYLMFYTKFKAMINESRSTIYIKLHKCLLFILHKVVLHNNKKQKTNAIIHMLGFALITFLPLTKCRFYLQTLELYIHVDDGFVYKFYWNCIDCVFCVWLLIAFGFSYLDQNDQALWKCNWSYQVAHTIVIWTNVWTADYGY